MTMNYGTETAEKRKESYEKRPASLLFHDGSEAELFFMNLQQIR